MPAAEAGGTETAAVSSETAPDGTTDTAGTTRATDTAGTSDVTLAEATVRSTAEALPRSRAELLARRTERLPGRAELLTRRAELLTRRCAERLPGCRAERLARCDELAPLHLDDRGSNLVAHGTMVGREYRRVSRVRRSQSHSNEREQGSKHSSFHV